MTRTTKVKLNEVEIFNPKSVIDGRSFAEVSDITKLKRYFVELDKRGYKRVLRTVENDSIEKVARLQESFPNFSSVIVFILDNMKLSAMSEPNFIRIPPIALGGNPGIGKTQFCRELSACINLEMGFINCSSNNTEFAFSGLDSGYSSGSPGQISEFFRTHDTANPVIVLDEFEKPSAIPRGANSSENFHGPFLTLLETSSASEFTDNYGKVKIDASYINWIATVNNFNLLPEPIRSRFTYFEIDEPSQDERVRVCQSIYEKLRIKFHKERGIIFKDKLEDDVARQLSLQNPREIRKALEQEMIKTVTNAFNASMTRRSIANMRFEIKAIDSTRYVQPKIVLSRGIGFLANIS